MKNVSKVIIAVVVAFALIASIAVIMIMTSKSGEKADDNVPSTVATESATQTTSETFDNNELEIFIDSETPRDDVSVENKLTEEKAEDADNADNSDDKNTQIIEPTVEVDSNLEEETVDFNQAVEDALSGKGEPIELPILPVD